MKLNKLKYVFAIVLLVVVVTASTTVQAAVSMNRIKLSDLANSRLNAQAIADGDTEDVPSYAFVAKQHNMGVGDKSYSILSAGVYYAAYPTTAANNTAIANNAGTNSSTTNSQNVSMADKRIGLALSFTNVAGSQTDYENGSINQAQYQNVRAYVQNVVAGGNGTEGELKTRIERALATPSFIGQKFELKWNSAEGRFEKTITDANGAFGSRDVVYNIAAIDGVEHKINDDGSITFYCYNVIGTPANPISVQVKRTINNGNYVPRYVNFDGKELVMQSGIRAGEEAVGNIQFYTNSLQVKVNKTLALRDNNEPGDATVANAVYGVYSDANCQNEVTTLTITSNGDVRTGSATTDPLDERDYWVKEISASTGCVLDSTPHIAALASARDAGNGKREIVVNLDEDVVYGGYKITMSHSADHDDPNYGSTTKTPSAGAELTLTHVASGKVYDVQVADEQGVLQFSNIPYGVYKITETKRAPGTESHDFMDPITVNITNPGNGETEINDGVVLVDTKEAIRHIQINIKDADSKKDITLAGAEFQIYDTATGIKVVQDQTYPTVRPSIDTFVSDAKGCVITPRPLPYGTYKVVQVKAPEGYQLTQKEGTVKVETNTAADPENKDHAKVTFEDKYQRIDLRLTARGTVVQRAEDKEKEGYTYKNFVRASEALPGVVYTIKANEEIRTADGTVHWTAGQERDFETNEQGQLNLSEELPLGSYTITLKDVPTGYVLGTREENMNVQTLDQASLTSPVVINHNDYALQAYNVTMTKVLGDQLFIRESEDETTTIQASALRNVLLGVYAKKNIVNTKGTKIVDADVLVDVLHVNDEGVATVSNLPMGEYYVKELETDVNYEKSPEKYDANCMPTNKLDAQFNVNVGEIYNAPISNTKVEVNKIETYVPEEVSKVYSLLLGLAEDGTGSTNDEGEVLALSGAEVKVEYMGTDNNWHPVKEKVDGKVVEVVRTTGEDGSVVIEGLPYGKYKVTETKAPKYYEKSAMAANTVTLTSEKPVADPIYLEDNRLEVTLTTSVKDEDGVALEGVVLELVDKDLNKVVHTLVTDEDGVATKVVRAGNYAVKVSNVPEQYVGVEDFNLEVAGDKDVEVDPIVVNYVRGTIVIVKTDAETKKPVPGTKFQVLRVVGEDEEDVVLYEELVTDENGEIRVGDLRYGDYKVVEVEAAKDYEKQDGYAYVSIHKDGQIERVELTNVFTGDIAVALYAVVALISAAVIARTAKKMKRN